MLASVGMNKLSHRCLKVRGARCPTVFIFAFFSRNEDVDGDCLSKPGEKIHEFTVYVCSCVSVGCDGCRGTSNTMGAHTLVTHAPNGGLNKHYFYFPNDAYICMCVLVVWIHGHQHWFWVYLCVIMH